ncbi:MAG: hypothetical protein F6K31_32210 [Symploca sp. SIO2G7]|nr:hypothetical protein [Symploca sp. SIO2G7]
MSVLPLKTELDVAEILLAEGWFPEEINSVLFFPLPDIAFCYLGSKHGQSHPNDVTRSAPATLTLLYRARQLLTAAGWLDQELNPLLKPCSSRQEPWAHPTFHWHDHHYSGAFRPGLASFMPTGLLQQYRRTLTLKRLVSFGLIVTTVGAAVILFR